MTAQAQPMPVSQRQIAWLHEFVLPGIDEALAALEQRGEIVILQEQKHGSN